MVHVIRCMNSEEYTNMQEYLASQPLMEVTVFNSYHKGFMDKLNELTKNSDVVLEYPRYLCKEIGWVISHVKKGRLRNVRAELLDSRYKSRGVHEILVIGGGYSD